MRSVKTFLWQTGVFGLILGSFLWLWHVTPALAQSRDGTAFQVQQLRQWSDNDGLFHTMSARTLGQWNFKLGAMFNYAKDPLLLREVSPNANQRSALVMEHQVGAEVVAGLGFLSWLDFELAMPVTLYQLGTIPVSGVDSSIQGRDLDGAALGDLRLALKFQALNERQHGFGLGAQVHLGLPTGSRDRFGGEESVSFGIRLLAHKTFADRVRLAFNVGYQYLPPTQFVNLEISHELTYGAGLSVDVWNRRVFLLAEVTGAAGINAEASQYTAPLEFLAGARFFPLQTSIDPRTRQEEGNQLAVHVGVGAGLMPGYGTPQVRVFLGLSWARKGPGDTGETEVVTLVKTQKVPVTVTQTRVVKVPVAYPHPRFWIVIPIQFAFDKVAYLHRPSAGFTKENAEKTLKRIAQQINARLKQPDVNIRKICVAGHAGVKGTPSRKQYLSDERAKKIQQALIQYGVPGDLLVWRGYSSRITKKPGTSNEKDEDRRVEVFPLPIGVQSCPSFRVKESYRKLYNQRQMMQGKPPNNTVSSAP